tara:strand:- start:72 stop:314 length:243 start_codon:yes stop_codon:yes gene_type:complete
MISNHHVFDDHLAYQFIQYMPDRVCCFGTSTHSSFDAMMLCYQNILARQKQQEDNARKLSEQQTKWQDADQKELDGIEQI